MTKFELASLMGLDYIRYENDLYMFRYQGVDFDEYVSTASYDDPLEVAKERAAERIFEAIADCISKFNLL